MNKHTMREFIQAYRDRPCLWQVKNDKYRDKVAKNKALEDLVKICLSADPLTTKAHVTKRINSMRSCFLKEAKKVKMSQISGAGTDDVHKPKLWYYEHLLFLNDQSTPRQSQSQTIDSYLESSEPDWDFQLEEINTNEPTTSQAVSSPMPLPVTTLLAVESPSPQNRKRKYKSDNVLDKILKKIDESSTKHPTNCKHRGYVEGVRERLEQIPDNLALQCRRLIDEALYLGEVGIINMNTKIDWGVPKD